jgi:rRNA maturation protein Nop10
MRTERKIATFTCDRCGGVVEEDLPARYASQNPILAIHGQWLPSGAAAFTEAGDGYKAELCSSCGTQFVTWMSNRRES